MPLPDYWEDLSQLMPDRLLPVLEPEPGLVSFRQASLDEDGPQLSESTMEAMRLLNQPLTPNVYGAVDRAHSATVRSLAEVNGTRANIKEQTMPSALATLGSPASAHSIQLYHQRPILSPAASTPEDPKATSEEPRGQAMTTNDNSPSPILHVVSHSLGQARVKFVSRKDFASHPISSHIDPFNANRNNAPSDLSSYAKMPTLHDSVEHPAYPTSPLPAVAARLTADVIADLKRPKGASATVVRPKDTLLSTPQTKQRRTTSSSESSNPRSSSEYEDLSAGEEIVGSTDNEDSDEEEPVPPSKARKIAERKRRLNAIAEMHMQARLRTSIEEESKVQSGDADNQSTRWLVNQAEKRVIISSPREYQIELYEKAKQKNIIAVLDTGSGKTLIAVLLLRHTFEQELESRAMGKKKRIAFFLVESVQLAFQQHAVLKANLDQPMNMFVGDMGCDLWRKSLWDKHFSENMVIICTAEVLRRCLHHSFISMEDINLLIFDEAHHAKKDHAYARIIKDFYSQQGKDSMLPKIFGMTASPVDARVDVKQAAAELEAILHCEIATAADPSLLQHAIKSKVEQLAAYKPLHERFETPLYKQMLERFKSNPVLKKPLVYSFEATRELGSWCADQVWRFCLGEEEAKKLQAKTERRYHAKKVQDPLAILETSKSQIEEARGIVNLHKFEAPDFPKDPVSWSSSNLSSKVIILIKYLKDRFERETDDKCIVFVKQRYTARLLAQLLTHPDIGTPYLFVDTLVGTRTGGAGDLNKSFREQVLTMMKFRNGAVNCLIATSVAEEGLDVPDCNIIVRFDLYTTLIQYIQSRGRARHDNSRYIHMYEEGNQEHLQIIREVRANEAVLKRFCNALPEDRKLTGNDYDMDHFLAKERSHRVYKTATGARLTYKISLAVLANFVDSLPCGADDDLQAEYIVTAQNQQFVCETILPAVSPIRGAIGRPAATKQVAKCSAAFETCLQLAQGKYLDEWLIPVFSKQLPAMRNALLAVDSKARDTYDMKTKPAMWTSLGFPKELFVTILELKSPGSLGRASQPIALMTRLPLPELPTFDLHFGDGRCSAILCKTLSGPVTVNKETVEDINVFNICMFDDVFSKLYESDPSKMPYFLVPVKSHVSSSDVNPSAVIAWDVVKSVAEHYLKWADNPWDNPYWQMEPDDFFMDKFVVDPYDGSRKLWSVGVASAYKPLDPVPPDTAPRAGTRRNNDNIMEYSCSIWQKARAKRVFDPDQRVIEADYISLRRNLLDQFDAPNNKNPTKCYVIIETLRVSQIPTTVVVMVYLFPAIIHRIESYLIAIEACELLHLNIRPALALEAVTKDSDNSNEHGAEKINFQPGMGSNYERLEFLGDCFLKMATSISIFGLYPENNEFEYHVSRMLLLCNKNLKNVATKLKLYQYIRSQSFHRRAWYPEGLDLVKGKNVAAPKTTKLGDKTIADVCEALIGAALFNDHDNKNMDQAVRAVTALVDSENHQATCFADYYKLYQKPKYQVMACTEMQRDMAYQLEKKHPYTFQSPRIARSAFTHPSYPFSYEKIPSYQRLEFLGDSLLDMACINYLFYKYPNEDPQWLTEHKMAMVSNEFLGALCVALGFHVHLLQFNSQVQKNITNYVSDIALAREQAESDAVLAGRPSQDCSPDYWVGVKQPPKCLPDVVEAYIGAIFVDSEFDYCQVERFFNMHIRWYFEDMSLYDSFASKHPTTFLTKFLQVNMGCMDWDLLTREQKHIDGSKPTVVAMVIVHGKVVTDAQAESGRHSKVTAAKKALRKLEGLPLQEFRERFNCSCTGEVENADLEDEEEAGLVQGTEV